MEKTVLKRLTLYAVLICLAGTLTCAKGNVGQPDPASEPTSKPIPVVVYNAAGRADVCADIAARIGPSVKTVTNFTLPDGRIDYSAVTTVIYTPAGASAAATPIQTDLGVADVREKPGTDEIAVVVGGDKCEPYETAPADGVLVDKSDCAVFYYEDGRAVKTWPCAIGKPETPTPVGNYEVTVTLAKPTWYWQGKAIPPGPENGLGDWFIGISKKGYGLHGTNEPASIGNAASHGCVRMYNDDVGELVGLVKPGTTVVITE